MKGAPKDDCLARGQDCHLIKQPACLHWDNPTEMIDIIKDLQSVADEIGTLARNRLTNLARSLARDNE